MIKSAEDVSEQEALQESASRNQKADTLVEKWARTDIASDIGEIWSTNKSKARFGAVMLDNQEKHMKAVAKRFSEEAVSSQFSTTPENVLKIIKVGFANSIRGDLFHEIALVTPDDALYYLDRKIETTKTNRGTADQLIYENVNPYYPSEQTFVEAAGTGLTTVSLTASPLPIRPNKIVIALNDKYVGVDNGSGTFTAITQIAGAVSLVSGTVDYTTTGAIALTFDGAIAVTDTVTAYFSWDSENSSNYTSYGTVKLATRKTRFAARPEPLGYSYSQFSEVLLGTTMGINTDQEFIDAVGLEHALAKDYRAIARAIQIANKNQTHTFNTTFSDVGEVSENARAQNLLSSIDKIGGSIYNDVKRGIINKAVAGTNMLSYMRKHKQWEENKGAIKEGPYKAGTLAGMEIFACPSDTRVGISANDAILLYKNPREGLDICMAIGTLTELAAKLVYPQMYVEGNVASVESVITLETRFARKLTLTGQFINL